MSGEDSLTSSETSSLLWECITESSLDKCEVPSQMGLSEHDQLPNQSSGLKTSLISNKYKPLQPRSDH